MRLAVLLSLALLCTGFEWPGRIDRLKSELESGEPERRREVVRRLSAYAPELSGGALLGALEDADLLVQEEAARALGKARVDAAAPRLIDALSSPHAPLRTAAARSLGELVSEAAVPTLIRALGDSQLDVRMAAIGALAQIGDRRAVAPLLSKLDDPDPGVRVHAANALGKLADPAAVVPLVGKVRDGSPEARAAVIRALSVLDDQRALAPLLQAVRDPIDDVALAAVAGLGMLGRPAAVAPLSAALRSGRPRIAQAAVGALTRLATPGALDRVLGALRPAATREAALAALRRQSLGSPALATRLARRAAETMLRTRDLAHVTALSGLLADLGDLVDIGAQTRLLLQVLARPGVPPEVVWPALARSSAAEARLALLEATQRAEGERAPVLLSALERGLAPGLGHAADPLLDWLASIDDGLRPRLIALIGTTGARRAQPALSAQLQRGPSAARQQAATALSRCGGPATALTRAVLEDEDAGVRRAAAVGLAGLADDATVAQLLDRVDALPKERRPELAHALGAALADATLSEQSVTRASTWLAQAAVGQDVHLAVASLQALARWGDPAALPALKAVTRRFRVRRRLAAVQAAGWLTGSAGRPWLLQLLEGDAQEVVAAAAAALGHAGNAEDSGALLAAEEQRAWPVGPNAAYGLATLAARGLLEGRANLLCPLLQRRDPHARANGLAALAQLAADPSATACASRKALHWLRHSASTSVRMAAAVWAAQRIQQPGKHPDTRAALVACARDERAPEVAGLCRNALFPGGAPWTTAPPASVRQGWRVIHLKDGRATIGTGSATKVALLPGRDLSVAVEKDPWSAPYGHEAGP